MSDLLVAETQWRRMLGLKSREATRVNIGCVNVLPDGHGGLHRWLHRKDLLAVLYREAERLESRDLRLLADRINEATAPKDEI